MVRGVAGCVHRHPLAPAKPHHLGILHPDRGRRAAEQLAELGHPHAGHDGGWPVALPAPRRLALPGNLGRLAVGRPGVVEVDRVRHFRVPPGAEALVGEQLRAVLGLEPAGQAEVVGVRVGHDDGVHLGHGHVGLGQPVEQRAPRDIARQPGVDDGHPPLVFQRVAVRVAETGEVDGQLHPQDAGHDLDDVGAGPLLLLLHRHRSTILGLCNFCRLPDAGSCLSTSGAAAAATIAGSSVPTCASCPRRCLLARAGTSVASWPAPSRSAA